MWISGDILCLGGRAGGETKRGGRQMPAPVLTETSVSLTRMTEVRCLWGFVSGLSSRRSWLCEELAFDGEQRRFLPHPSSLRSASADRPFSELLRSLPPFARKSYPRLRRETLPRLCRARAPRRLAAVPPQHGSHLGFRAIRKLLFPVKFGAELYAASSGGALVVLFAVSRFSGASAATARVALPPFLLPQTGSLTRSVAPPPPPSRMKLTHRLQNKGVGSFAPTATATRRSHGSHIVRTRMVRAESIYVHTVDL